MLAPGIGPAARGWLVEQFGWRAVFFLPVPFCVVGLILDLGVFQSRHFAAASVVAFALVAAIFLVAAVARLADAYRSGTTMTKTILLAYNGTREGRAGLFEFTNVIPPGDAQIHLLAVVRIPTGAFLAEGFVPEAVMDEERIRCQEVVDEGVQLLVERGYRITPHLAYGEPTEEIVELAKRLSADLIVVGHQRATSMAQRWWKGSVGASLIEVAPCSILIAIEG